MSVDIRTIDGTKLIANHFLIHRKDVLQNKLKLTHNQLVFIIVCNGDNYRIDYMLKPDAVNRMYQALNEENELGQDIRKWLDKNFLKGEHDNDQGRNQKADPEEREE